MKKAPKWDERKAKTLIRSSLDREFGPVERERIWDALGTLVQRVADHGNARGSIVRDTLGMVGDTWSSLILLVLRCGTFRHSNLRRVVSDISGEGNISQRMLTLKLRHLEREGFVSRKVWPTVPPRVDYALTPLGLRFTETMDGLILWIEGNYRAIDAAREEFDRQAAAGLEAELDDTE